MKTRSTVGLKIGDWVLIEKSGEVIPKVLSVIKSKRTGKKKHSAHQRSVRSVTVLFPDRKARLLPVVWLLIVRHNSKQTTAFRVAPGYAH